MEAFGDVVVSKGKDLCKGVGGSVTEAFECGGDATWVDTWIGRDVVLVEKSEEYVAVSSRRRRRRRGKEEGRRKEGRREGRRR